MADPARLEGDRDSRAELGRVPSRKNCVRVALAGGVAAIVSVFPFSASVPPPPPGYLLAYREAEYALRFGWAAGPGPAVGGAMTACTSLSDPSHAYVQAFRLRSWRCGNPPCRVRPFSGFPVPTSSNPCAATPSAPGPEWLCTGPSTGARQRMTPRPPAPGPPGPMGEEDAAGAFPGGCRAGANMPRWPAEPGGRRAPAGAPRTSKPA